MNQKEKILAIAIIGFLVLGGVYFVYGQISSMYTFRNGAISKLQRDVRIKESQVDAGMKAQAYIDRMKKRALPADIKRASTLYQHWYLDQAKELGLDDIEVSVSKGTNWEGVGQAILVKFSARGDLDHLTRFLYAYYRLDIPHKILMMRITPVKGSRMLIWDFQSQAAALQGGQVVDALPVEPTDRCVKKDLEYYRQEILGRNIFGRPNTPPTFSLRDGYEMRTDKRFSLDLRAEDPDPLDKVTFTLDKDSAEGAELDGDELTFRTEEPGDYQVTLYATDDGLPSSTTKATITITAVDPPPKKPTPPEPYRKPSFADAPFVLLSAVTVIDGKPQAWLRCLKDETTQKLAEGEKFTVGNLEGIIHRVDVPRNEVDMTVAERHLIVTIGKRLDEAKILDAGWDDP